MTLSVEKFKRDFVSDDYILDDSFIRNVKRISGDDIVYHNSYAEATTAKSLKIYIPYQWFVIASFFVEYYQVLMDYKAAVEMAKGYFSDFDDTIKRCRDNEALAQKVVDRVQGVSNEEKVFLVKFLSDYTWWGGGKKGGGKTIDRTDFYVSPILNLAGLVNNTQGFVAEIVKEFAEHPEKANFFNYRRANITSNSVSPTSLSIIENNPVQIIYYGVPGCGKSHQIQEELRNKNITEENHQVKRVVFHPDYCNADFVGQILPVTKKDGHIRYLFKAGPFTKILRDAYANPDKEYALIIEEINRGNAAAIFGDLFQLLDRKRESDQPEVVNGNSYGPGWSDYCVENDYINAYFRGAYEGEEIPDPLPPKTLGKITFNDNVDIRLPPNLSLYATMNTSDQNVFTLDNAFQRRWEMKQISNDLKNDDAHPDEKAQYDQFIGNTGVKWGMFREKINEIIMQSAEENGLSSMEDKRLGGWFIIPKKASDAAEGAKATITSEAFAEKVLKYLWDDAFKFDRKSHFGDVKTLEELIEKFKTEGFKVFSNEQISGLSQNGSAGTQTGTSES